MVEPPKRRRLAHSACPQVEPPLPRKGVSGEVEEEAEVEVEVDAEVEVEVEVEVETKPSGLFPCQPAPS